MEVKLVCDTRERAIQDMINGEFRKPLVFAKSRGMLKCEVKQIDVGDYAILDEDNSPLAIIERKSLKDYAASFKDGRHTNRVKLLNFRNISGCKIFYIVEGPLNPDYETEFAGIKYQNILASVHDLMLEYGIYIIRTLNGEHTAKELRMLCESYLRVLKSPANIPVCTPVTVDSFSAGEVTPVERTDQPLENINGIVGESKDEWKYVHPIDTEPEGIPLPRAKLTFDEISAKSVLTPEEELEKARVLAWAALPRVGQPTAAKMAVEFLLSDWITGKIDQAKVANFTFNGRKNSAVTALLSKKPSTEMQAAILAALKGFTKISSLNLVTQISLEDLLNGKDYSHVRLGARSTKLTSKRVAKILLFLSGENFNHAA